MLSQEKISHLSQLISTMKSEILELEKVQGDDKRAMLKQNLINLTKEIDDCLISIKSES